MQVLHEPLDTELFVCRGAQVREDFGFGTWGSV